MHRTKKRKRKIDLARFLCSLGTEDDLEYYVRECGDILGVSSKLPSSVRDAKHILDYIFHQIVEFKKLNQVTACHASLHRSQLLPLAYT